MSTQAKTHHTTVDTKLIETRAPDHGWGLALDPKKGWFPRLGDGFITLNFKASISREQAEEFERLFDQMVETIDYTEFF
jgi:hypothetical protein